MSVFFRVEINGRQFLARQIAANTFKRVGRDGSDWSRSRGDADEEQVFIGARIVERVFVDRHFGELLPLADCRSPIIEHA